MTCRTSRSRRAISCSSSGSSAGPGHPSAVDGVAEAYHCAQAIYGDNAPSQLARGADIDCSYEIGRGRHDLARYRVNMIATRAARERGLEITLRTIPTTPPTLDSLALPVDLRAHWSSSRAWYWTRADRLRQNHPVGRDRPASAGAAGISPKNHHLRAAIEFVYDLVPRSHALIAQHEIGVHLPSFAAGVRNSLRRKPMVILVGESRDAETIDAMILAAQTGHLVYTTAHTNSVPETLHRLVEPFPVQEREGRLTGLAGVAALVVPSAWCAPPTAARAGAGVLALHPDGGERTRVADAPFKPDRRGWRGVWCAEKGRPLVTGS